MLENKQSDSIAELAKALAKAQAVMTGASRDAVNPHLNKKYADLASVWEAVRKPLTDNGLSVLQEASSEDGFIIVVTTLMHSSGEFKSSSLKLPVPQQTPQGYGSAITYARRYALSAITGNAPEDDDGVSAGTQAVERPRSQPSQGEQAVAKTFSGSRAGETPGHNPASIVSTGRVYSYKLPFKAKDDAKARRGRWDAESKTWNFGGPQPDWVEFLVGAPAETKTPQEVMGDDQPPSESASSQSSIPFDDDDIPF